MRSVLMMGEVGKALEVSLINVMEGGMVKHVPTGLLQALDVVLHLSECLFYI